MDFSEMKGKTFASVYDNGESIVFTGIDGSEYMQWHEQDCCESVRVEEIHGDLNDLVGSPILDAYETSNSPQDSDHESCTYTFYSASTIKGSVTIRWCGSSNGYYSESVSFECTALGYEATKEIAYQYLLGRDTADSFDVSDLSRIDKLRGLKSQNNLYRALTELVKEKLVICIDGSSYRAANPVDIATMLLSEKSK